MRIPLKNFEQYIDDEILDRGLDYFETDSVTELEEISVGKYEALVEGSKDYTVRLTLKDDIIENFDCDCPYNKGPVCKHEVAVFYYLKNISDGGQIINSTKIIDVSIQVNDLLEKVSHEELMQFVRVSVEDDPQFRNKFLSTFAKHNSNESKELYLIQVKSILESISGRNRFIDWESTNRVAYQIDNLLETARKQIDARNFISAFYICTAVMEQLTVALEYSDDSSGDIGGSINWAFDILFDITKKNLSEETRKIIFEYCYTSFKNKIYSGWDWHIGILELASLLIKTDEEAESILKQIDNYKKSDFEIENLQNIKYDILLKINREDEAEKFLEQNIKNSQLRRRAIQNEYEKKNFEKAAILAKDGVSVDMKSKPGLALEWYDWLLKIALAQKDNVRIIEYARLLLIENFTREQDYYQILKKFVEPEKWVEFIEAVVSDISKQKRFPDINLIASIYIKEKWWERLFDLVKRSKSLYTIEQYEKHLSKNYAHEIADLYSDAIKEYMENNVGRKHYQHVCNYIRKIKKLSTKEKSTQIITYLKTKYPTRRALIEELSNVE